MNEFNYDDSAYLAHHGVKGMKWGVRKDRSAYRTSDRVKGFIRRNGKKIAIGAGIAAGTALAVGGTAYGINKYRHSEGYREKQARKRYNEQESIIERIKNNPDAHSSGSERANYVRQQHAINRIKSSSRPNHKASARAQYLQNGTHTGSRPNYIASARAQYTQNGTHTGSTNNAARAQYLQQQRIIERINSNPNAYSVGDKYAKKRNR